MGLMESTGDPVIILVTFRCSTDVLYLKLQCTFVRQGTIHSGLEGRHYSVLREA